MIFLRAIRDKLWPYLALVGAAVAALFAIRQSGKSAGRAEVKAEHMEADLQAGRVRNEATAKIDRMDDDAVRELARERMRNTRR